MRVVVVCLLSAVLVLAGCGVPVQREPVPIKPEAVPSQLQGSGRATSPQPTATPGKPTVQVNFVRNDKLVTLVREAPAAGAAEGLNAVIEALVAGPTDTEQAKGITTALPPDLTLTVVDTQGPRVVLELSSETDRRSATENILTVGQIVFSVTALPTVDEVTFSRDGVPVEALLADGALSTDPLTAADYEALRVP